MTKFFLQQELLIVYYWGPTIETYELRRGGLLLLMLQQLSYIELNKFQLYNIVQTGQSVAL